MRKLLVLLLSASLVAPAAVLAGPGGYHGGPGFGGPGWHGGPGPGRGARFPFLPGAAETVLIAGLTYYVLNGIYYQRQNDQYVVVQPPPAPPTYVVAGNNSNMTVVDMNGERFYVNQGHYYRRTINGDYLEVPRPPGL
ncbi:hypothetical protein Sant_1637 [Sodalis praecaptivus]|uniref:Uncharacterized protein n=1 Tax=Sodalis praecaptivus TaxID=1239307 RepID=W0HVZ4_9GAMM|nr:DUF6515 family protein [Sodalis praecaptivus]AHF76692.1 hypothetical protein Sant_1637 [Sodalis praecaptivus]